MKTLHIAARAAAIIVVALFSSAGHAETTYAKCVLENLNWVQNDSNARGIIQLCMKRYPGAAERAAKEPRWMSKYTSGAECGDRIAKATGGNIGPRLIVAICYALYEPPPAIPESAPAPAIAQSDAPLYFAPESIKSVAADMATIPRQTRTAAQPSAAAIGTPGTARPAGTAAATAAARPVAGATGSPAASPATAAESRYAAAEKKTGAAPQQAAGLPRRCVVKSVMTDAELAQCKA